MTQTKAELLQTRHQGDIRLGDADSTHYVGFKAPATVSSSLVWTLPAADGSSNQYLKTDGSGALSWGSDSAGMPTTGGTFTGNTIYNDNVKAVFGTGNDAEIYHSSSDNRTYIRETGSGAMCLQGDYIKLQKVDGSEDMAVFQNDGAVELYHNNVKTLATQSNGITVLGPEGGAAQINLYSDEGDDNADNWRLTKEAGNNSFRIQNYTSGSWETSILATGDAGVHLYHDNSTVCYTDTDALRFNDNKYLKLGSSQDLKISHNGTNSIINNNTGDLYIQTDGNFKVEAKDGGNDMIHAVPTAQVELHFNGVKKYETSAAGSKFTGGIAQVATAVSALELDLNTSNYFTKTISGNSTFTFANPAASGQVTAFTLELTHSSGTVTWPASVKWNADTAPTLTTGKTHLFMFVTDDGGTRYRGSALVDYVN